MQVDEGGRKLNAVIIGSPNINPGTLLEGDRSYPRRAEDYMKTFSVLKSLPVDLFLGAHGSYFGLKAKYPKMASGTNPFIDPSGYKVYVAEREMNFLKELAQQKQHPGSPAQ
jgi:metallo-beta-lactamase class B